MAESGVSINWSQVGLTRTCFRVRAWSAPTYLRFLVRARRLKLDRPNHSIVTNATTISLMT